MQTFNLVEILKQFSKGQKLFVLIFTVLVIAITYTATTYISSEAYSCREILEENKKLIQDYVLIATTIREMQMENMLTVSQPVLTSSVDTVSALEPLVVKTKNPQPGSDDALNVILEIAESNIVK